MAIRTLVKHPGKRRVGKQLLLREKEPLASNESEMLARLLRQVGPGYWRLQIAKELERRVLPDQAT